MEFEEFKEKTIFEMKRKIKNGKAELYDVIKNNGKTLTGLIITLPKSNVSPVLYLEEYYEDICNGIDFTFVIDKIWNVYLRQKQNLFVNLSDFVHWEKVQERVVVKVINYEANKDMLKTMPHKRFLDLAVVYCYIEDISDNELMTILLNKQHMNWWSICEEELYETACANYEKFFMTEIISLHELLKMYCRNMLMDEIGKEDDIKMQMYVVTNQCKLNGASIMLFPEKLKKLAEKWNSDLYLLPSSIHEIITLPAVIGNPDGLKELVRDINNTQVLPEERLADSVYRYCYESGEIVML